MHAESFTGVGTNAVARLVSISSDFLLNVPVVTVKSEMTVWGRLFRTVGEAWQKAHLEEQQLEALGEHKLLSNPGPVRDPDRQ